MQYALLTNPLNGSKGKERRRAKQSEERRERKRHGRNHYWVRKVGKHKLPPLGWESEHGPKLRCSMLASLWSSWSFRKQACSTQLDTTLPAMQRTAWPREIRSVRLPACRPNNNVIQAARGEGGGVLKLITLYKSFLMIYNFHVNFSSCVPVLYIFLRTLKLFMCIYFISILLS